MAMTLTSLVFKSMKKNVKHYYLYFFALIFSVTLCFSFATIQYNPSVEEALAKSGTATDGFNVASYMLYLIVIFFIMYANQLFMKRRSKEIGLYQMIGMTKGLIFRLLVIENVVLFILAVGFGMVLGFLTSRLFAMVLMKLILSSVVVTLTFSMEAFTKSIIIFAILLAVVVIQIFIIIRRTSLLNLFHAMKKADERIKNFSLFHMIMGLIGIGLIAYGYFDSTRLFSVDGGTTDDLFTNMWIILGSTIVGTYLFFRFSVALIMNMIRKSKNGHLKITDVLGVTTIMHRMKGNTKSLTLITLLTGLAVGIMTLSYISYYSTEESAKQTSPYEYILLNNKGIEFLDDLKTAGIQYEKETFQLSEISLNLKDLFELDDKTSALMGNNDITSPVVSLSDYKKVNPNAKLNSDETMISNYTNVLANLLPEFEDGNKKIELKTNEKNYNLTLKEVKWNEFFLSSEATFGSPVFIVPDKIFDEVQKVQEPMFTSQIGVNLVDASKKDREKAEELFKGIEEEDLYTVKSYEENYIIGLSVTGMLIFITGYLGLAFLLTTGSILYFKQMSEAEDERESYTILRKIGFSNSDLMRGIFVKQLFNFGMPLIVGLLHSYFAVKSGWWLFGTEMVAPMLIIMGLYIALYAIFAVLSGLYYKRIVKEAL